MNNVFASDNTSLAGSSSNEVDLLVEHCVAGEESAFVAVYKLYAGLIYRLCFGLLQHREDSEEVLQDTFEYAFRKINKYDARKASFKTWLYRIAISRCRNKRRRKWLVTLPLTQNIGETVVDASAPAPLEVSVLNEQQQVIWRALGELSPKIRETLYLRYYEALTYAEIGIILNIPSKTAESRVRLGHKTLRSILAEEFEGIRQEDDCE